LGDVLRVQGRTTDALELMHEGEQRAVQEGAYAYAGFMAVSAADDLFTLGRWAESEQRLRQISEEQLSAPGRLLAALLRGRLATGRGQLDEARAALGRAAELVDASLLDLRVVLCLGRGEWLLAQGEVQSSRSTAAELLQEMGERYDLLYTPALLSFAVRVEAEVAAQARASDQDGLAAEAATRAGQLLAQLRGLAGRTAAFGGSLAVYEAHVATAVAEIASVEQEADAKAWARAATRWLEVDHRPSFAYARLMEAAAILRVRGAVPAVSDILGQVHAAADAMGARPLRERAEACAAGAGIKLLTARA
jgi:hypothetical protein